MATYESISSATALNTNSVTVTKPTGLAVGDLLVAGVVSDRDAGASTPSLNTPTDWTLEESVSPTGATVGLFSKIADSSDVAASNFTFTASSVSQQDMGVILVRFSSPGSKRGEASGQSGASGTTTSIAGFTPTASSTHIGLVYRGSGTAVSVTSLAYATNDPTFTERAEIAINGTVIDGQLALYTATRAEVTATGNITATFGAADNTRTVIIALAYSAQVNGEIEPTTQLNTYALSPITKTGLDVIVDEPNTVSRRQTSWTEPTRQTTDWTNKEI